ncbi:globin domain-containing protein [Falsiruegeria mediterranea]|uniref:Bacterial hemoglobin n=1 Tax=Falsiruegeria mediterranea M17 TaxID=1200281 RepID=A0A2R8CDA1_9RHOB|nr:globin domain-containing protein [Falsiruegeria mediterranea]SPJ30430.1 Bacterial hemoglobin [Falsiruegeria mediterranea M17]
MDSSDIALVQSSFARVFARKAELTDRFYKHLFACMPEVEPLFRGDFVKQKEMFATMLASTVRSLSNYHSFTQLAQILAQSHARFELTEAQMTNAAQSLMAALHDVMAGKLTPEEKAAWTRAITKLTSMMVTRPATNAG